MVSCSAALRLRDRVREPFARDRHLDELLLVHLQRAVAAAEGDAPLAVAEDLDLVVARLLDVELEQDVLVVADAGRLDLGEHLADERRHLCRRVEDALALAAAAADRLQAEAPAGVIGRAAAPPRAGASRRARRSSRGRRAPRYDASSSCSAVSASGNASRRRPPGRRARAPRASFCSAVRSGKLAQQGAGGRVVHARRDRHVVRDRRALRLVLGARRHLGVRARADEADAGLFEPPHELRVLRHETVAGENVAVAVLAADRDHLLDALDTLLLRGPGVVGHRMHVAGVHDAQLGGERARKHDAVAFREQDPDLRHAHLADDVDRFLADGAAADDQDAHVVAGEGSNPGRARAAEAAVAVHHGIVGVGGNEFGCRHRRRRKYLWWTGGKRQHSAPEQVP